MKQSIYQKLLMSIAIVAFFGTMATSQVLNREDVSREKIENAKLRHQQTAPKAVKKDAATLAKMQRDIEEKERWKKMTKEEKQAVAKQSGTVNTATAKPILKNVNKPTVERKALVKERINIHEKAKQITPPPGYKVTVSTVRGKQYIEFVELPQQYGMNPVRAKN